MTSGLEDGLDKTGVRRSRLINGMAPELVTETNEGAMPLSSEPGGRAVGI